MFDMMRYVLIKLLCFVLPAVFSSCRKEPAPAPSYIVVEPDWSACEGVVSEDGYSPWTVKIGDDYAASEWKEAVHKSDAVFAPGVYAVSVYSGAGMSFDDGVISQQLMTCHIDGRPYEAIEYNHTGAYYGRAEVTVTDNGGQVSVPIEQYARMLYVNVEFDGNIDGVLRLDGYLSDVYAEYDTGTGMYGRRVMQRLLDADKGIPVLGMPSGDKTIYWLLDIHDSENDIRFSGIVEDRLDAMMFYYFNDNKEEPFTITRRISLSSGENGPEVTIR